MAKKHSNQKNVIQSRGSADHRSSSSPKAARGSARQPRKEVLDGRQWRVASIAWNKDGNIVILDPAVAEFVHAQARADREFEIGISPVPVEVDGSPDGDEASTRAGRTVELTVDKLPAMNSLCVCTALQFQFVSESPVMHELLSNQPLR
jgi:hypothetical protein